jgi:hypothetical protein
MRFIAAINIDFSGEKSKKTTGGASGSMPEQLHFDFDDLGGRPQPKPPRPPAAPKAISRAQPTDPIRVLEDRFGVILNKKVRLKLFGWDEVFEGKLLYDELLLPESRQDGLPLRLGKITFDYTDIEYVFLLE